VSGDRFEVRRAGDRWRVYDTARGRFVGESFETLSGAVDEAVYRSSAAREREAKS
jgi:hypothetical protein